MSKITAQDCVENQTYLNTTRNLFFGFSPPGDEPEIFAEGIISTDQYEFAITFSADGNDIFFTRRSSYENSNNNIRTYLRY